MNLWTTQISAAQFSLLSCFRSELKICHIWQSSDRDGKELSTDNPGHTCFWIDSYTFGYIEKLAKMNFDKCLSGSNMSIEFVHGTELTEILFTQETAGNISIIQEALDELSDWADNLKRLQALLFPKCAWKTDWFSSVIRYISCSMSFKIEDPLDQFHKTVNI